jgi:anthranilate phosphoribosyltransferase
MKQGVATHGQAAAPALAAEHPFAAVVRTVAKGEKLGRSLTMEEAREAMRLVLEGGVEPVQLGAFLAVLRYRKETGAELAGFALAARDRLTCGTLPATALDWPSYADRHRQLPYFVLAALLAAGAGVRVLMHGVAGEGPAGTRAVLRALGVPLATDAGEAERHMAERSFAYLPLEAICPDLERLFALRPLLGLRSPANTYARELNPAAAPCQIQGVFHPNYADLHAQAASRLGQPRAAIFKGGGGEGQINPLKPVALTLVEDGQVRRETWPALLEADDAGWRDEPLEPARVVELWRGRCRALGPEAAIVGTAAVALHLTGRSPTPESALAMARELWESRDRARY